jgi:cytochrome bd ubiquinol oxidase subunit II
MTIDLTVIWAGVIAFAVIMYVLLDGFDLGVGILFPWLGDEDDRDTAMTSVAPVWDFNETWLVLGGAGLFGAFPLAYATLLPAFYLPLLAMLIALVFRGVAFEFRFKVAAHRRFWSVTFFLGSLTATFAQGVVLGAFVQGIEVEGRAYAGGPFDWATPFAAATGASLVAGYGLLGATWLAGKTARELRARARRHARRLLVLVLAGMAIVSLWAPLAVPDIAARWFSWPNLLYLSPVPILVAATAWVLARDLGHDQRGRVRPFLLAMGLFLLGFAGLAISLWPAVVPPSITIWEAAAPRTSQVFLLVGVGALIPVLLAYVAYTYWVFRGEVADGEGYHH